MKHNLTGSSFFGQLILSESTLYFGSEVAGLPVESPALTSINLKKIYIKLLIICIPVFESD